ncbi:heat shock protein 9/12-domain-containing protein [Dioszegia hungarica]|uniref:Heat shock protein 9/12-domain-containing protein n=1 Tax=Dioszegia hungarica TaxID=4972 RepID=A0AA38H7R8_9TREE|nr:heat shock protein 9/12-domain-containing protein [Dioszegia hungarica]KAI9633864.1 heat shock protein 9/12-domain-containing protein [Dioszegia hungarica]
MSDMGRQSLGDKAGAALKPDSQKSYLEQATDTIKGKADSAASSGQPESQKSFTQQAGDAISGNQNENSGSLLDSAKNALGMNNNNAAGSNTKNL